MENLAQNRCLSLRNTEFSDGLGGGITQSYSKEEFNPFVRFAVPLYAAMVFTIANAPLQSLQSSEICL